MPLDDYINFEEPIMKANKTMDFAIWKGKHYGVVYYNTITMGTVVYNRSLLEREGQPDILGLYESDNWNWTTFQEIAVACTRDTNGDGIVDQWGLTAPTNSGFASKIIASNAAAGVLYKNGDFVYGYAEPQAQRALQFLSDLTFVYKVYLTSGKNQYLAGKVAMNMDDAWNNGAYLNAGVNSIQVPPPKGPDMPDNTKVTTGAKMISISSLCEVPEEAAKIAKEVSITWQEDGTLLPVFLERLYSNSTPWAATASTQKEYLISNLRTDISIIHDFTNDFDLYSQTNAIVKAIMDGTSPATAIEKVRLEIESVIDNYR